MGYDVLGNSTTVSGGTQNLITNSYEARTGKLMESTYGNGHKVAKDYDNLDRAAAYKAWNSSTGQYEVKFRYSYDASGTLATKRICLVAPATAMSMTWLSAW